MTERQQENILNLYNSSAKALVSHENCYGCAEQHFARQGVGGSGFNQYINNFLSSVVF